MKKPRRERKGTERHVKYVESGRKFTRGLSHMHTHKTHDFFLLLLNANTHTYDNREEEKCVHSTVWRSFACFFFSFLCFCAPLNKSLQLRWKASVGKEEKCPQKSRNTKLILIFQVNYHTSHTYIHSPHIQSILYMYAFVCVSASQFSFHKNTFSFHTHTHTHVVLSVFAFCSVQI